MATEELEERRDRLQITMWVGVTVGAFGLALQELCEMIGLGGGLVVALALVTLAGWVTFAIALFRATRIAKAENTGAILEDERRDQLRAESFKFGFVAIMSVQVLGLVSSDLLAAFTDVPLSVSFMATLSIAVGVTAALGRFVHLNR